MTGFVEVVVDHWVFDWGWGFLSSTSRKLTKNVWGAASELQLKNRIEKKIKESENKKK